MGKFNERHFQQRPKIPKPTKNIKRQPIKITYISNPTTVTLIHASEFQAVVQQLTGKDAKFIEDSCHWNPNPNCNNNGGESSAQMGKNIKVESSSSSGEDSNGDVWSNNTSSVCTSVSSDVDDDMAFWSNLVCTSISSDVDDDMAFWSNLSESFFY